MSAVIEPTSNSFDGHMVLDEKVLNFLPGGKLMMQKVLKIFLKSSAELMARMDAGLQQNDTDQVLRAAHTLKSSSAMIGAHALSKLCVDIETITFKQGILGVDCLVQEVHKARQQVENEICSKYSDDDAFSTH